MIQSYKRKIDFEDKYDAIIIGSGMGSLTTAALLSKEGKKVLVLERHYVAGGFTHVFKRKGYEWDVGIHYIGEVQNLNSPIRKMFDYVSDQNLKWEDMGEVYDRIIIGDKTYDFVKGVDNFKNKLVSYFPDESDAIEKYIQIVFDCNKTMKKFYIEKALPSYISSLFGSFFRKKYLKYSSKTTFEVISSLTNNKELIKVLKTKNEKQIGEMMKLSEALSSLNYERFQNFGSDKNPHKEAAFVFNGEVYAGLNAEGFTEKELTFATNSLRILSGLYGILKPGDIIQPYRLEMGTKLKFKNNKNLYDFWGDEIANFLNKEEQELIINLASNEYNKVAKLKTLDANIITPNFKEFKNGSYKTIMVYAKKARGMMARWIIQNEVNKIEILKSFNQDKYCFNEELSDGNDWIFTR